MIRSVAFLLLSLSSVNACAADSTSEEKIESVVIKGVLRQGVIGISAPHATGIRSYLVTADSPIPVSIRPEPVTEVAVLLFPEDQSRAEQLLGEEVIVRCGIGREPPAAKLWQADFCFSRLELVDDLKEGEP